jgi:hypothetical protein
MLWFTEPPKKALDQAATRQIQELSVAYHLVRQGARPRMLNKTRRIHGSWFW